jgi:hypothetical protein
MTIMSFKSQFYWAYVAGLSPFHVMKEDGHDSYRHSLPAAVRDQASADLPRTPLRRKPALLFILALGLASGALQFLSHTDGGRSADVSAQASLSASRVLHV